MSQTSLIQVRVNNNLKHNADELFNDLGLDTVTAIRIFLSQAVKQRGLPFEVKQNALSDETVNVLKDVEKGRNLSKVYDTIEEMMVDLLGDYDA